MNYSFWIILGVAALVLPLSLWGTWREADRSAEEEIQRRKDKP